MEEGFVPRQVPNDIIRSLARYRIWFSAWKKMSNLFFAVTEKEIAIAQFAKTNF